MKKLLFLLLFPFMANAQIVDTSQIQWTETEWNFGKITYDIPVTHKFTFVNKSKFTTEIISVEASCGCTEPTWTKTPILPGDTAFVQATFNAKSEGLFTKQVTIYTDRNSFPTILLLKGEVIKNE